MKMLVHRATVPSNLPFALAAIKAHSRIDGATEDGALTDIGLTAATEIESFAQIALLNQTIRVTVFDPPVTSYFNLPIRPVDDSSAATVLLDGVAFEDFQFVGGSRPSINWGETFHTQCAMRMTVEYQAGFGDLASDVPRDLAQAILDQAARHYDRRSPLDARELTTPPHMARIGAKYRGVRT